MHYEITEWNDYRTGIWIRQTADGHLTLDEAKAEALQILESALISEKGLIERIDTRDPDFDADELAELQEHRDDYAECVVLMEKNIADIKALTEEDFDY